MANADFILTVSPTPQGEIANSSVYPKDKLDQTGASIYPCYWEDWELDMHKLSAQYPEATFSLYCWDANDDAWVAYFRNGKLLQQSRRVAYFPALEERN